MNSIEFLHALADPSFWQQRTVIWLVANEYPSLFIATVYGQLLHAPCAQQPSLMSLHWEQQSELHASLQQTFLGMRRLYWLGSLDEFKRAQVEATRALLMRYTGPHTVLCFSTQAPAEKELPARHVVVSLDEQVTKQVFLELAQMLGYERLTKRIALVDQVFTLVSSVTLDHAVMLMRYLELLPVSDLTLANTFLVQIMAPDRSLSRLAALFFLRKGQAFFELLEQCKQLYPPMFWVTFWSNQLWQATHVVGYMQQGAFAQARRVGNRLPSSFLREGWQKHRRHELTRAHEAVYRIDYQLKNGLPDYGLDVFYAQFFNGTFGR